MENSIKLSDEKQEELINELLVYMQKQLELHGRKPNTYWFDFHIQHTQKYFNREPEIILEGKDLTNLKQIMNITDDEFIKIINICITNDYIKENMGDKYANLQLTDEGFGLAKSVRRAKYKPSITDGMSDVKIGTINATNLQIGNNNIQNITNIFHQLIDEINNADCAEQEKKTALTQLKTFINNPIVSNIISGVSVEILKKLTGLGI